MTERDDDAGADGGGQGDAGSSRPRDGDGGPPAGPAGARDDGPGDARNDGLGETHDHDDMLWRSAAVPRVLALREDVLPSLGTETVPVDAIAGRVLAEPVEAPADAPAADHATMDGYAFDAAAGYPYTVVDGEVFPEDDPPAIEPGQAVRIATGAALPPGADAVLKREEATVDGDELSGPEVTAGTYVYRRASNVAAGERLFDPGERLEPADAILLRDVGRESVAVRRRLSVAVLATGSELHADPSGDLDSPMLLGLVRVWGHEGTYAGTVPDEYDVVEERIAELASAHDVVVTTGGTSVGHKDHVLAALRSLGEVLFHRVRIRPGKPIGLARLSDHEAVAVAVPGKPIGAFLSAALVARPLFTGEAALPTLSATLDRDVGLGPSGFEYLVPVTLADGEATPLGHVDSPLSIYGDTFDPSVLSSATRATRMDGVVVTTEALSAGEAVEVVPTGALGG